LNYGAGGVRILPEGVFRSTLRPPATFQTVAPPTRAREYTELAWIRQGRSQRSRIDEGVVAWA